MKTYKTYKQQAEYQNMCTARVKAIAILEFLQGKKIKDGIEWYNIEDEVTNIIKSQ